MWIENFDALLVDVDGVLLIGGHPLAPNVQAIDAAMRHGIPVALVTNNTRRCPGTLQRLLTQYGLQISLENIYTPVSVIQALRPELSGDILVCGSSYLKNSLQGSGVQVHTAWSESVNTVVLGIDLATSIANLDSVLTALEAGCRWIATSIDETLPTALGIGLANGSVVSMLSTVTGRKDFELMGKPSGDILRIAQSKFNSANPLVIGDSLSSDVCAAQDAGFASLALLPPHAATNNLDSFPYSKVWRIDSLENLLKESFNPALL